MNIFAVNYWQENMDLNKILNQNSFSQSDIVQLLQVTGEQEQLLFQKSATVKSKHIGNFVYFRGLIEFSNICQKDCLYCGIRASNKNVERYSIANNLVLQAAEFAYKNNYASVVLQSGERTDKAFINNITFLLKEIKKLSNNQLGITISLGEQTKDTYQKWFDAGAHRYLLRIESSNPNLYQKIHPNNKNHQHTTRLKCLQYLQDIGYQTGTGVMVGLPFQDYNDLANDLLFMQQFNIDMVGMGPFIEHAETPIYQYRNLLMSQQERLQLTLRMLAILRIMMPDINIAAATALQAIDALGREKALQIGANVIMPNITPTHCSNYQLYQNKPFNNEGATNITKALEQQIRTAGMEIGYGEWGDSKHYIARTKQK